MRIIAVIFLGLSLLSTNVAYAKKPDFTKMFGRDKQLTLRQLQSAIRSGADLNSRDLWGKTALMYAQPLEVVEALIKAGADVNARSKDGFTVLMQAKDPKIIEALIKGGADVDARDQIEGTALMNAVTPEAVASLIRGGADVNAKNKHGWPALFIAAHLCENPAVVTALLKGGADVNARVGNGETALMAAIYNKNPEVLTVLIKAGIDVNAKSDDGRTALMFAMSKGMVDKADLLKKAGAQEITTETTLENLESFPSDYLDREIKVKAVIQNVAEHVSESNVWVVTVSSPDSASNTLNPFMLQVWIKNDRNFARKVSSGIGRAGYLSGMLKPAGVPKYYLDLNRITDN